MTLRKFLGLFSVAVLAVTFLPTPSAAQGTANYLKLDGIAGDVTVNGFEKVIEVLSFSWGLSNSAGSLTPNTVRSSGVASFSDFSIMIQTGRALPDLFIKTAIGDHIPTAVFTVVQDVGGKLQERVKLEFEDVLLTSFQLSGAGELPVHSVSMSYARVTMTVWVEQANGMFEKVGPQSFSLTKNQR